MKAGDVTLRKMRPPGTPAEHRMLWKHMEAAGSLHTPERYAHNVCMALWRMKPAASYDAYER